MYSNYLSINKNFQSSVNLELDLNNELKINEYIPTSDICDVLKRYVKSILGINKDKATTLIGPYGKGKSFLFLILLYLCGKQKKSNCWINLSMKIKQIDEELYLLVIQLKEKDICLLPVIINSNYENITQSFQIALAESLKREGLDIIVPNSTYSICLNILDKWESQDLKQRETILEYFKINSTDIFELRKGLENFSLVAYKKFESIYNSINLGLDFNPLINRNIVKTYSDVSQDLNNYGYNGMFIVFDEFSKFLENTSNNLSKEFKIIQDMAELSARSDNKSQINLCCIAHKSLALYAVNYKNVQIGNLFRTVEGRFKEVRFNRSIEENYQIISSIILKTNNAQELIKEQIEKNEPFYKKVISLPLYANKNNNEKLIKECFPLNPLTAYCLVQISEYLAQNERTLFTFLSDTDDDSFNSFIHANSNGFFNVDKIYDYFLELFKREKINNTRNICYRAESILAKLENQNEKKVIKALSIILMINNLEKFKSDILTISLSINLGEVETQKIINNLVDAHYIRNNNINNQYSFALLNSKKIDEEVELRKKTKFKDIKYGDILNEISDKRFVLPRKYNEENKITRFYKILFLSETDFLNIASYNYYFNSNYCDGLIICLLRNELTEAKIKKAVDLLSDKRIIVKYSNKPIDNIFYSLILEYSCLKDIKNNNHYDEIVNNEINLLLAENESDIKLMINKYFYNDFSFTSCAMSRNDNFTFNELINNVMYLIFTEKLVFNNELINKKTVSTQYQKAVNHVIDWLLEGEGEFKYSETSPEMFVKNSILNYNDVSLNKCESSNNFRKIIDNIKAQIFDSCGKKINIFNLFEKYKRPPFGLKNGILPLIFSKVLSELTDNIILYYDLKEIQLNANNIIKSLFNNKYTLVFSKSSIEQKEYLTNLLNLFGVISENNFRKDTNNLSIAIRKFFVGLPQIVRTTTINNNFLKLETTFIDFRNLFLSYNLNPFDALYIEPCKIFNENKYNVIFETIKKFVKEKDLLLIDFKMQIIQEVKLVFSIDNHDSLKMGIGNFIKSNVRKGMTPILEEEYKKLYKILISDLTFDDDEEINKLSKMLTDQFIEDWDTNKSHILITKLSNFKEKISSNDQIYVDENSLFNFLSKEADLSSMGILLKNNIESVFDEFADSVSSKEKLSILRNIFKKLL